MSTSRGTRNKTPLHAQIYRVLRERIDSGTWKPGFQLPKELDLADEFQVSRGTARQAITRLASEGAVERTAGRGTFVSSSRYIYPLADLLGFTEQISQRGQYPSSKVLHVQQVSASSAEPDFDFGTKVTRLLSVERVRNADGEPVALEKMLLPYPRFAGLTDIDLENASIYETLEEHFGVRIRLGDFTLDVDTLSPRQADLLSEEAGSPVFLMTGGVFDQDGRTIVGVRCYYRRDKYSFRFSMPRRHADQHRGHHVVVTTAESS